MFSPRQRLALLSFFAHASLAVSLWLSWGTVASSPAWDFLSSVFPYVVFPIIFGVIAILALVGFCRPKALRLSFLVGGTFMVLWALGIIGAWSVSGSPAFSAPWILMIAYLKYQVWWYDINYPSKAAAIQEVKKITEDAQNERDGIH